MPLHHDFITLSKAVRPRILKLARQGRLVDECFKEFQRKVYPGAPQDQVACMRTCFFAGAAEMFAMQAYASDTDTMDPTDEDLELLSNINAEIERFHQRTIEAAKATPSGEAN